MTKKNMNIGSGGVCVVADFEAVKEETMRYTNEVRRQLPVEKAILFGSYANGTATEWSDIDIAFFLRDYGGKTRFDIGVELLGLCRGYKKCIEPHVFDIAEIERDNPFVNEILSSGVEILP